MSDDLIRRSDAIKVVDSYIGTDPIVDKLKDIPSAENKGEWIISEVKFGNYKYQCKECGWYENHAYNDVKPYNYCPNCGARMKGTDNE